MPRKLLPKLLIRLKRAKKALHQTNPDTEVPSNQSPNLLSSVETQSTIIKVRPKIIGITNFVVGALLLAFLVLFITDRILDIRLNKLKDTRDKYLISIERLSKIEKSLAEVDKITGIYKNIKNNEFQVSESSKYIIDSLF